jgi:hypothetical protein
MVDHASRTLAFFLEFVQEGRGEAGVNATSFGSNGHTLTGITSFEQVAESIGQDIFPPVVQVFDFIGVMPECWGRCLMGSRPSPYNACHNFLWGEELIRGDHRDETLPFQWDIIELNLPGDPLYDPTQPWVRKRRKDGHIASNILS